MVVKFAEGKKSGGKDQNDFGGNNFNKNDQWFGNQQNPQMGGQYMVDPNGQMNNNAPRNMFTYSMPSPVSALAPPGALMPFQMRPPATAPFSMGEPPRQVPMAPIGYGAMAPFNHGNNSNVQQKPYRDDSNVSFFLVSIKFGNRLLNV